jgi:hypothetical protein
MQRRHHQPKHPWLQRIVDLDVKIRMVCLAVMSCSDLPMSLAFLLEDKRGPNERAGRDSKDNADDFELRWCVESG